MAGAVLGRKKMSLKTYISKGNELDTDDDGAQRITPAGSTWVLSGSDGDLHYLDCDETGASIICDSSELATQFSEGGAE